jgi:prepilin-type N-terminal cleavage/methylation domain-containing protein/prepilin-type processing-associated H-X9-DG protein
MAFSPLPLRLERVENGVRLQGKPEHEAKHFGNERQDRRWLGPGRTVPPKGSPWRRPEELQIAEMKSKLNVERNKTDRAKRCVEADASRGAGFTLIELIVVIAVIAVLGAMQIAAMMGTKTNARTTQCLSNMKQLQVCWQMYATENNGLLPLNGSQPVPGPGAGGGSSASWVQGNGQSDPATPFIPNGLLYPYNKTLTLYACPANTRQITFPPNPPIHFTSYVGPQPRTVSINYPLGGFTASGGGVLLNGVRPALKYSEISNPAPGRMFVFVDENEFSVDDGAFALAVPGGLHDGSWWNLPGSRHNKGTTWSFADGHVEYWKWHGTAVLQFTAYYKAADSSDDLARVQACTSPLAN